MMDYIEIDIITEILMKRKPRICLEWGSGYSTIYFPRFIPSGSKWISIEHERKWFHKIKHLIGNDRRIEIYWAPSCCYSWTDPNKDGSFSDLKDYIEFPEKFGTKFDFILIDGRARLHCLRVACKLMEPDGVVVLHDANRKRYHNGFRNYRFKELFLDKRNDFGGLFIGSKKLDLDNIITIDKYKLKWKMIEPFFRVYQATCSLLSR
jgi:hypothetical protein